MRLNDSTASALDCSRSGIVESAGRPTDWRCCFVEMSNQYNLPRGLLTSSRLLLQFSLALRRVNMKKHAFGQNSKRGTAKPGASSKIEPRIKKDNPLSPIIADLIVGLLLTGLLLVGKTAAEHTQACKFMEESFYDLLQLRLSSKLDAETLKVIVVD